MAKKLGKGEKLDRILSEVSALRAEVKKLLKQQAPRREQAVKARVGSAQTPGAKAAAQRPVAPRKAGKAAAKPAAVEAVEVEPLQQPASRRA